MKSDHISQEEIEERLKKLKGRLPSFLIYNIKRRIKGRKLTEEQFEKIIEKTEDAYLQIKPIVDSETEKEEIRERIVKLEREMEEIRETVENILSDLQIITMKDFDLISLIDRIIAGEGGGDENDIQIKEA